MNLPPVVLLPLLAFLASCSTSTHTFPDEIQKLQKAGFTHEKIVGVHASKTQRLDPDEDLVARALDLIGEADAPRHAGLANQSAAHYTLQMYAGSFKDADRLTIEVTTEGDGWLQRGKNQRLEFFSPELAALLAGQTRHLPAKDLLAGMGM